MEDTLDDAVGLIHVAMDYIHDEDWEDATGCLEEAIQFVGSVLSKTEAKAFEDEDD